MSQSPGSRPSPLSTTYRAEVRWVRRCRARCKSDARSHRDSTRTDLKFGSRGEKKRFRRRESRELRPHRTIDAPHPHTAWRAAVWSARVIWGLLVLLLLLLLCAPCASLARRAASRCCCCAEVRKPDTHMTCTPTPVAPSLYEYEYVDRLDKTSRFMLRIVQVRPGLCLGHGGGTQVAMWAVHAIARFTGSTASVRPHWALIDKT